MPRLPLLRLAMPRLFSSSSGHFLLFSIAANRKIGLSLAALTLLAGPLCFTHSGNAQTTSSPGTSTSTSGSSTTNPTSTANQPRFTCQTSSGQPVVMYHPESQPGQYYPWATPSAMGGGWTPERRCNEIARRLETYRPDGLVEMQTGLENGYNTVCVTTEKVPSCRIVFTVPRGQDPTDTRDRVFQNLTVADSGQQTQGVYTYTGTGTSNDPLLNDIVKIGNTVLGGSSRPSSRPTTGLRSGNINLKPFLDYRDGGTGSMLRSGTAIRKNNPRLNPANFR